MELYGVIKSRSVADLSTCSTCMLFAIKSVNDNFKCVFILSYLISSWNIIKTPKFLEWNQDAATDIW